MRAGVPRTASDLLGKVQTAGLDAPVFSGDDPRWARLVFQPGAGVDLRDRFRGALVGGAIGDAMGRPNEGTPGPAARERRLREYQPWRGWSGGPKGTITDDTQMTMWLAEAILSAARREKDSRAGEIRDSFIDPHDLAERFTREQIRGIGQATREFVHRYKALGRP